jgi:formylglycine-generating enzyme
MKPALTFFTTLLLGPLAAHALDIDWVTVGDAGNAPDKTGYGAVAYEFQIAKFEVTIGQYAEFLNAVAANDPRQLWTAIEPPPFHADR